MKYLYLVLLITIGCSACTTDKTTSEKAAPVEAPAAVEKQVPEEPVVAEKKAEPQAAPSYEDCMNYCVEAMDQAGQVTDECPVQCKQDTGAYTAEDIISEDEDMGLIVGEKCLSACVEKSKEAKPEATCKQACCVGSCERRQDYKGSSMGPECPGMCREFLKRTAEN